VLFLELLLAFTKVFWGIIDASKKNQADSMFRSCFRALPVSHRHRLAVAHRQALK
jgi:hypothetical protein